MPNAGVTGETCACKGFIQSRGIHSQIPASVRTDKDFFVFIIMIIKFSNFPTDKPVGLKGDFGGVIFTG